MYLFLEQKHPHTHGNSIIIIINLFSPDTKTETAQIRNH